MEKYKPETPEEYRKFYGEQDSGYFYELLAWNFSPFYQKTIAPLKEIENKRVLVVGGGLGGEVEALRWKGNSIFVFELPGALRDFLKTRFIESVRMAIVESETVQDFSNYINFARSAGNEWGFDTIVAVDTIEHFHPDEFREIMDALLSILEPDGEFYLRNNFDTYDKRFPTHFDHAEAYQEWLTDNELEVYRTVPEVEGQFVKRK
jgi:SAM-dependent methyltransferase